MPTTPESRPPSSDAAPARPARNPKGVLAPALRLALALLGALAGQQTTDRICASSFAPHLDQTGKLVRPVAFMLAGFAIGCVYGVALQSPSGKIIFTRVLA